MKTTKLPQLQDRLTVTGLIMLILSAIVFVITVSAQANQVMGVFFINYTISAGYFVVLVIHGIAKHKWRFMRNKLEHTIILLLIWFVSAYSLNREMNVFDDSVAWLCVYVVAAGLIFLAGIFYEVMPDISRRILFFLLGSAFILFFYLALFLFPLYGVSIIGVLAIGISLHTYIPACIAAVVIVLLIRAIRKDTNTAWFFGAGALWPVSVCLVFVLIWNNTDKKINQLLNQNTLNEAKIPAWMVVSQKIERSAITERILKAGLVYHEADVARNFFWGDMPSQSFDQKKQHDPLVVIAGLFSQRPNLDEQERIKILKSMYDSRHHAQDRLWAGDKLETISVVSNVKLFPEYRMAYTEKTLTIRNTSGWEWGNQEAIYTFYLSEGSVVTSLSLWIDGKEEKSRLTTKAKADSAYKQIVGVEQHDPSVIHWQEGNNITVRVFPCPVNENRKFRVGVTSPLRKDGDKLVYENIYFEGPVADKALETAQISFSDKPEQLQLPEGCHEVSKGVYQADRDYEPYWEISCKAPQLAGKGFSFNGSNYTVADLKPQYGKFDATAVYLDLNSAWTMQEIQDVYDHVKAKPVYTYTNELERLTDKNLDSIYNEVNAYSFSLFPVYKIADPEHALIISKSTEVTPNLQDLEGSEFAKRLAGYLETPKQIRLFSIGNQLSPYLKALKELRVLNYESGTTQELFGMLGEHQFVQNQENDSTVVIGNAKFLIKKTSGISTGTAPDHLLRLFAYNDIMKKVSANYFNNNYVQPDVIGEAEKAYVVTPVSSLIVLETKKDYERFNIGDSKNSLKNASMKSSGSVPEPHEWLLILLFAVIAAYLILNSRKSRYEY